ncbi:MAG: hypothetical protein HY900_05970, partial [Deltaproteobacteria bacterium]|nr:hypothetical protein [Deltaproteobacteria bacterium]
MDANKVNRFAVAFGAAGFIALGAAGALFFWEGRETAPPPPAAASAAPAPGTEPAVEKEHDEHAEGEAHSEADGHGHGHGSEKSDLDRPVDELWAQKCEHNIPQHECDECRYELGAGRLAGPLWGEKAKPGLGMASKAETRTCSAA